MVYVDRPRERPSRSTFAVSSKESAEPSPPRPSEDLVAAWGCRDTIVVRQKRCRFFSVQTPSAGTWGTTGPPQALLALREDILCLRALQRPDHRRQSVFHTAFQPADLLRQLLAQGSNQ